VELDPYRNVTDPQNCKEAKNDPQKKAFLYMVLYVHIRHIQSCVDVKNRENRWIFFEMFSIFYKYPRTFVETEPPRYRYSFGEVKFTKSVDIIVFCLKHCF